MHLSSYQNDCLMYRVYKFWCDLAAFRKRQFGVLNTTRLTPHQKERDHAEQDRLMRRYGFPRWERGLGQYFH